MPDKEKKWLSLLYIIDNIINISVRFIMLPVLICGIYIVADTAGVYADAGAGKIKAQKPEVITDEELKKISGNCVAWLEIDGTDIDYPVMQSSDNVEYLNKDPYGNYSLAGSIFLDFRNSPDFTDGYSLIYGHHMSAGLMFGAMDGYTKEDYFKKHLTGKITAGDKEHKLHIYAFLRCDAADSEVFNTYYPVEDRIRFFKEKAWYTDGSIDGKRLVALTTCKAPGATDRSVLICWIE